MTTQAWGTRWAPRDTIRSKIEKKLTEGKLRDRESAAYPNTPWAHSGLERIYIGPKVPPVLGAKARPPSGFRRDLTFNCSLIPRTVSLISISSFVLPFGSSLWSVLVCLFILVGSQFRTYFLFVGGCFLY